MKHTLFLQVLLLIGGGAMHADDVVQKNEVATFAGGCFWCMEAPFEILEGVETVLSGYAGGKGQNPTYGDYAQKGYVEAVQIAYDPQKISYEKLLDVFWHQIDPTDNGGQFVDRGPQYRSAIFYHNQAQKQTAEKSKIDLQKSEVFSKQIVTEIVSFTNFYKAEDYHQHYYKTHPIKYHWYRWRSGRDSFLKKSWGAKNNMSKK